MVSPLCGSGLPSSVFPKMSWGVVTVSAGPGLHPPPFPELALLIPAILALERLELLPKPSPYPAEAGFSGNPQIQTLRKLDLLFTSSRLAAPSVSAPQSSHYSENVVPQLSSLLEPRRELSHAG